MPGAFRTRADDDVHTGQAPEVVAGLRANEVGAIVAANRTSIRRPCERQDLSVRLACCDVQSIESPSRVENVDAREARNRAAVADGVALGRLTLAIAERPAELIRRLASEQVA